MKMNKKKSMLIDSCWQLGLLLRNEDGGPSMGLASWVRVN